MLTKKLIQASLSSVVWRLKHTKSSNLRKLEFNRSIRKQRFLSDKNQPKSSNELQIIENKDPFQNLEEILTILTPISTIQNKKYDFP